MQPSKLSCKKWAKPALASGPRGSYGNDSVTVIGGKQAGNVNK